MKKLITVVIIGFLAAAVAGAIATYPPSPQQELERLEKSRDKNSLKWFAKKAKLEGKQEVVIPGPFVEYLGVEDSPEQVLETYSLVVAQPVKYLTLAPYEDKIVTWYKFKILETISQRPPCPVCPELTLEPPPEMLPLKEDEFLLSKNGGSVSIDGVKVTMVDPGLPPYSKGKKYLLFISRNPSGVANLWAGPYGAYSVTAEGLVESVNEEPHPIKETMKSRFNNSLDRLKQQLKGK